MASAVRLTDGSLDFSGGVDSGRVTTVQSAANPNGLPRTQLAWLTNGTVRSGGIGQRTGWQPLILALAAGAIFQGGWLYEPDFANPYLMLSIGGRIYSALVEAPYTVTDLSAAFGLVNPATVPVAHFAQAEQFLIIQAGDLAVNNPPTLPLFWDGTTLRRSHGLQNTPAPAIYQLTTTAPWTVPAAHGISVAVTLNAPYPGAVGDIGTWSNTAGTTIYGTFYVGIVAGNVVTLILQATSFFNAAVPVGTYTFTVGPAQATVLLSGSAPFIMPAVGASVVIPLPIHYLGNVGDILTLAFPNNPSAGTGTVTNIGLTDITFQVASTPYATAQINPGYAFNMPTNNAPPALPTNELPAAGPMVYYHGQVWYAQGRQAAAGDYVGDQGSGTLAYGFKDSVLKVTENPLVIGGDGFAVPDNAGDITALDFTANLNSVLGQGVLYVFTRKQVYALNVPITRDDWIAASSANQPLMTVAQRRWGAVGDRCVVPVNGDLFYQSLEPAVRSLKTSIRNDAQWLNPPVSRNENRVLRFNDRALMSTATGINFDNRLWQAILPVQTPVGAAFQAVAPLDFDVLGSLGSELNPAWEGMYEGLDHLQLFSGDFGGRERAFSVVHNRETHAIEVWELTNFAQRDNGDSRVEWFFETPAYTFGKEFAQKQLDGAEVWLDRIAGTVDVEFEYRVDADPCWQLWHVTSFCAARSSAEDVENPVSYPVGPDFCEGYKFPITLPTPPPNSCQTLNKRPTNRGYQFQMRVTFKGWCRVRGLLLFALPLERAPFEGLNA